MQNAYEPPESSLEPASQGASGFGSLNFDRALNLAWATFKANVGLGVGGTLLFGFLSILSVITIVGIFFFLPVLQAGTIMLGLSIARGKPTMNSLFAGFSRYGSVFLGMIILGLLSFCVAMIFSFPTYQYLLRGFPFERIGVDPWTTILETFGRSVTARNENPFDPDQLWRTFFSYLHYPISMYIGGRFLLVFPLIIDRRYPAISALKTSWEVTAPFHWWLLLVNVFAAIVSGMGVLACCVGILFTIPFGFVLQGAAVLQLLGEDAEPPSIPPQRPEPEQPY